MEKLFDMFALEFRVHVCVCMPPLFRLLLLTLLLPLMVHSIVFMLFFSLFFVSKIFYPNRVNDKISK